MSWTGTIRSLLIAIAVTMVAGVAQAESWTLDGKVRLGGIWLDQTGDESTMPETYNIYDGFSLSSIYLKGRAGDRTNMLLDLTEINLDGRRGVFDFRRAGMLHVRSRYSESRWLFDPAGEIDAGRKNWFNSVSYTPWRFLWFSADYNLQVRDGSRIDLNPGLEGWLGTEYDSKLHRYRFAAEARTRDGIGGSLVYDGVAQRDALNADRERDGYIVSANLHAANYYLKNVTHVVRGAFGRSELRTNGLGFDMMNLQYTGIWQAMQWFRMRYHVYGSQIDDESTTLQTNHFFHDVDGTVSNRVAALTLGYGWEALDDDRIVTTTNKFRGSLLVRDPENIISARIAFDGRNKEDEENTTLLRDSESQRWDLRLDARPIDRFSVGARFRNRDREYPDLNVESEGEAVTGYAAWHEAAAERFLSVTDVGVEYTFSDDEYDNLSGMEHIASHAVTGRVGMTLWEDFDLMGSFTYLSLEEDLDLEKSIISVGAGYRLPRGFLADVRYNVYNYDDYVLIDRIYTANVVWVNVGYEFNGMSR